MSDHASDPNESALADAAAVGAALLLVDLHEAMAEATAQLAALTAAAAPRATAQSAALTAAAAPRATASMPTAEPGTATPPATTEPLGVRQPDRSVEASGLPTFPVAVAAADRAPQPAAPSLADPAPQVSFSAPVNVPGAAMAVLSGRPVANETQAPSASTGSDPVIPAPASPQGDGRARDSTTLSVANSAVLNAFVAGQTPASAPTVSSSPQVVRSENGETSLARWDAGVPAAPGGADMAWAGPASASAFAAANGSMTPQGMSSAAPPPSRQESGPTGGDVYLDGTRVGRWLADTLAREAGGPAMGGTGFDPRLGPTWPGALQGNGA